MGHILLLILKILGILILILLGLLIFVIASVLLIPVRYSFAGKKTEEEVAVTIRFHWFLHILSFYGGYDGEDFSTRIRIFGIPIKSKENSADYEDEETEDDREQAEDKTSPPDEVKEQVRDVSPNTVSQEEATVDSRQAEEKTPSDEPVQSATEQRSASTNKKQKKPRKKGFSLLEKIKNFFQNMKCTCKKICAILKKACASTHSFLEFVQADSTKQAFSFVKRVVKYLFKHLKPRKVKGELIIGFEDPSVTGQCLAVSSLVYPLLGEQIKLYPDFENEVLEGNIQIKGHVRAVHALRILWHFFRDKNMMQLIKKFKNKS